MKESKYLEFVVFDTSQCLTLHAVMDASTKISTFVKVLRKQFLLKDNLLTITNGLGLTVELSSSELTLNAIFLQSETSKSNVCFTMHRTVDMAVWNISKSNQLWLSYHDARPSVGSVSPGGDCSYDEASSIGLHSLYGDENDQGNPTVRNASLNTCRAIVPVTTIPSSEMADKEESKSVGNSSMHDTVAFAGLVNSGMTCYMNSLLQTLFMTPEFRNALYLWRFSGTTSEAVTSIPYQLQRLFVQLQTTRHTSVSTTGVTTSFGWRSHDVIQQQDIHELCRIMFDALEKKLSSSAPVAPGPPSDHSSYCQKQVTGGAASLFTSCSGDDGSKRDLGAGDQQASSTHDLINRLYQGKRSDCVRCTVCNRISCRPDSFLDIQVPLRPFEQNAEPYGSLEAAFRALIKPERLDGTNQYYCARCQTKRDAERVCGFHKMPYLLTLQLMRFTFDMTTLNRIKLNDRFTFPLDRWDLTELITPIPVSTEDNSDTEKEHHQQAERTGTEGEGDIEPTPRPNDDEMYATISSTVNDFDFAPEMMMVTEEVEEGGGNIGSTLHSGTRSSPDTSVIAPDHYNLAGESEQVVAHEDNAGEEGFEEMETETIDSGVNSVADSPYGMTSASSTSGSGSPSIDEDDTLSSPHEEAEGTSSSDFVLSPDLSATSSTLTATGLAGHHSAMAEAAVRLLQEQVVRSPSRRGTSAGDNRDNAHSDEDADEEEQDDGFGTGDTRSACSSSSHTNRNLLSSASPAQQRAENSSGAGAGSADRLPSAAAGEIFQVTPTRKDGVGRRRVVKPKRTPTSSSTVESSSGKSAEAPAAAVYELFSIMVHSGSINGGHYYAYIRSFTDNQWYCFNDQRVSKASQSDLEQTFGSGQKTFSCQANAYFLMYRRVDPALNETFMTPEHFPPHIREMVDALKAEEAEAERQRDLELSTYKFEAYTRSPVINKVIEKIVHLYKGQTISAACNAVREALLPELPYLKAPNCRLVEYTQHKGAFRRSWDFFAPKQRTSFDQTPEQTSDTELTVGEVAGSKLFFPFELWLEHRVNVPGSIGTADVSTWRSYQSGGLTLRVHRVDITQGVVYDSDLLWLSPGDTVQDLAREVWQLYVGRRSVEDDDDDADETRLATSRSSQQLVDQVSQIQLLAHLPDRSDDQNRLTASSCGACLFPWACLLASPVLSGASGLSTDLCDQLFDSNCRQGAGSSSPITVYLDLGPGTDGLAVCNSNSNSSSGDSQGSCKPTVAQAKRGRWQLNEEEIANGSARPPSCEVARLHRLCALVEEHLFSITVTLELPSDPQVSSFMLLRKILIEQPPDQPMDVSPLVVNSGSSAGSLSVLHNSSIGSLTTFSQPSNSSTSAICDSSDQVSPPTDTNRHNTSPVSWQDDVPLQQASHKAYTHLSDLADALSTAERAIPPPPPLLCSSSGGGAGGGGSQPSSDCKKATDDESGQAETTGSQQPSPASCSEWLYAVDSGEDSSGGCASAQQQQQSDTSTESCRLSVGCGPEEQEPRCGWTNCQLCPLFADSKLDSPTAVQIPLNMHSLDPGPTPLHPRVFEMRLDRRMKVSQFISKVSEHIPRVEPRFIKVFAQWAQLEETSDLMSLRSGARMQVVLNPELSSAHVCLQLHILDLDGLLWRMYPNLLQITTTVSHLPPPVGLGPVNHHHHQQQQQQQAVSSENYPPVWGDPFSIAIRSTWTVCQILSTASAVLATMFQIPAENIPPNRLILRRCSLPDRTPGPKFEPGDRLCSFGTLHQGIMLQLPSPTASPSGIDASSPDASSSPTGSNSSATGRSFSVFARRWPCSSAGDAGRWHELVLPSQCVASREDRWSRLVHCLASVAQMPVERLLLAKCDFPGVSNPEVALTWTPCATAFDWRIQSAVPNNGQVVYFRGVDELDGRATVNDIVPEKRLTVYGPKPLLDHPVSQPVSSGGLRNIASSSSLDHLEHLHGRPSSPVYRVGMEQSLRIYTAEEGPSSSVGGGSSSRSTNGSSSSSFTHRTSRRESRTP